MVRFALNQPQALGDFEDIYASSPAEDIASQFAQEMIPAMAIVAAPAAAPASSGIFDSLWSALTAKPVVNAALNKYIFGSSSPIPTATNMPVVPSSQIIAGVPNSYLFLGGAAVLLLVMSKKRR